MIIIHPKDLSKLKSRDPVKLKCEYCLKYFVIPKNRVLANIKRGNGGKYCSSDCQKVAIRTGKTMPCLICSKLVYRKKGEQSGNIFCSLSCAAKHNGHAYPKRKTTNTLICKCGGKKNYQSITCDKCHSIKVLNNSLLRTIKSILNKGNARTKYASIRKIAHRVLQINKIPKLCHICHFDICVDVCHIKAVSEFDESCLVGEVNALNNLVYLCPNHHRMLDRNLLSII